MCLVGTISGIPPMLGFTFAVTMTGFIYGFPNGSIPAMTGAILSAMLSFGYVKETLLFIR